MMVLLSKFPSHCTLHTHTCACVICLTLLPVWCLSVCLCSHTRPCGLSHTAVWYCCVGWLAMDGNPDDPILPVSPPSRTPPRLRITAVLLNRYLRGNGRTPVPNPLRPLRTRPKRDLPEHNRPPCEVYVVAHAVLNSTSSAVATACCRSMPPTWVYQPPTAPAASSSVTTSSCCQFDATCHGVSP